MIVIISADNESSSLKDLDDFKSFAFIPQLILILKLQ